MSSALPFLIIFLLQKKKRLFSAFDVVIVLANFCAANHLLSVRSVGFAMNPDSASLDSCRIESSHVLVLVFTEEIAFINWPLRKALSICPRVLYFY